MEGFIKNEVIEKLVGHPMLLNIIFKANKNKSKSKRRALYLNKQDPAKAAKRYDLVKISLNRFI